MYETVVGEKPVRPIGASAVAKVAETEVSIASKGEGLVKSNDTFTNERNRIQHIATFVQSVAYWIYMKLGCHWKLN
jgi:hypothetical protein